MLDTYASFRNDISYDIKYNLSPCSRNRVTSKTAAQCYINAAVCDVDPTFNIKPALDHSFVLTEWLDCWALSFWSCALIHLQERAMTRPQQTWSSEWLALWNEASQCGINDSGKKRLLRESFLKRSWPEVSRGQRRGKSVVRWGAIIQNHFITTHSPL